MNVIAFCIKRPVTTIMFFVGVVILGIFCALRMPIDLLPEITYPAINISTSYSGAGPEEIEDLITIPVEQAVATVNKVKSITSVSEEGRSRVTVQFDWGLNLDESTNDIRANLDRIRRRLPDDADQPTIFKYDPSSAPIATIGLSSESLDEQILRQLAEDDLSYQIQKVDGVAGVDVRGGRNREIRVYLKQERLQALGIPIDQVSTVIENANVMLPAGNLSVGVGDFLLRTKGEFSNLEDIQNLVVLDRSGTPVYLRDLAVIEEGFETTRQLVRIDGIPGIVISVQKRSGANTVAVADQLYKTLDDIRRQHPEIRLRILNDNSTYIRQAVQGVADSAVTGAILAAIILLFFLHSFRATMVTALVMPIAILATLMLAFFGKMTLNTISLGGLALGVGMLVDNAVVVLDNVFRKFETPGMTKEQAALEGTSEMSSAILASTLTTVCVFLPLLFVGGRTGIIFKELSYMVSFSLICSLMVAMTLMPMLCAKFLKIEDGQESGVHGIKKFLVGIQHSWEDTYQGWLEWCLGHKWKVVVAAILLFALTLALGSLLGSELIQSSDEGVISIRMELPAGTRLEETDALSLRMEQSIREYVPELVNMEASVGGSSVNQTSLTVRLSDASQRRRTIEQIMADLQQRLQNPGVRLRISARSSMRMLYGGSDNPIAIDIRGYDQELARQTGDLVMERLRVIPGINNVNISRSEERPELGIVVHRKRAADLGVSVAQIASAVQTSVEGTVASIFRKNGEETQIRVNLQEEDRRSWQDLGRIMVSGSNGRTVPLMSIVELVPDNSPVEIERRDQERNVRVEAGISGRDMSGAMDDIRQELDGLSLPTGINLFYGGDYEEQAKSFAELTFAIVLGLILVYMVMAAQFESYLDPLIVMFSVPFALGGVVLMLLLTDTLINNQVYIGLIILGGVVVNNAIVLITYIQLLMQRGADLQTAVLNGARSRLRPILITTITTLLGLVPMALGIGEGAELQAPMARTVIGGLTFSTIVSLFLIPVIFVMVQKGLNRLKAGNLLKVFGKAGTVLLILGITAGLWAPKPVRAESDSSLTLAEAITIALEKSEDGKIIRARRTAASAAYAQSRGANQTQLSSELETVSDNHGTDTKVGLEADRSLPLVNLFGLQSLQDIISECNRNIVYLNTETQEQQLIQDVVVAFQGEILAARDFKIAEENYQRSEELLDQVLHRSKLGLTSITDETGAEAQLATASTNLNRVRHTYRIAQLKLRQLLAMDPAAEVELIPPESSKIRPDLELLKAETISLRADLRQLLEERMQTEKLLELARLSEGFGIALEWNFEREHFEGGLGITNQSSDGFTEQWRLKGNAGTYHLMENRSQLDADDDGTVTLRLKWKLWDGKIRKEKIREAEAYVTQADQTYQKQKKNALLEVEEAYFNYLNQLDKLHSSALQLKHNQTYLDAANAKLRAGLASVQDVLDAQLLWNQAETDYQRTISDLYLAEIGLLKVSGQLEATVFEKN